MKKINFMKRAIELSINNIKNNGGITYDALSYVC